MATALGMKPPGIAWLGQFFVPLRHAFGSVEAALLFSIVLTQAAVLVLIYWIGVDVAPDSRGIGFLAAGAAAGAQAFVGLSHQYFVEPLQCLAVAWTILIALRCNAWPGARTLIHVAASTLLGVLAKASTPVYALVPIAVIVLSLIQNQRSWDFKAEWRRWPSKALVCALLVSGAFGALWYAINYAAVLRHVRDASSGEIALNYGLRAPVAQKYVLWLRFLEQAFLEPYLVWILGFLALAAGVAVLIVGVPFSRWRRQFFIASLSVAQIALVLFAFALNDALETRYLYALLPYVTIVIVALCSVAALGRQAKPPVPPRGIGSFEAWWDRLLAARGQSPFFAEEEVPSNQPPLPYGRGSETVSEPVAFAKLAGRRPAPQLLTQGLVVVVCLAQWVTVNRASFAITPVLANQFPWLNPIITDSAAHGELSEAVRRTSIFPGYNIVGVEEPWLNANSAAFFAAKNRLKTGVRSYYTSLGYAEKDTSAALQRIEDFSTRFVITLDEPFQPAPDFLNLVSLPVLRELKNGQRFARAPFSDPKGIVIFERQHP